MKKNFFLIILTAAAIAVFYGVRYVRLPVDTEVAYITKCEEKISGSAFFIRNESVSKANKSGMLYTYPSDGDRVGKTHKIATIYNSSVNPELLQEINNIDKKIKSIKTNASQNMQNSNEPDEARIVEYTENIIDAVYEDDLREIYLIKNDIKAIRDGTVPEISDDLSELQERKDILEEKMGKSKNDIYSQQAGVFISGTDGFEHTLTPEIITNMTVSDFDALPRDIEQKRLSDVSDGDEICKVADNNEWYIVMKAESEKLSKVKKDDNVKIRFDIAPGEEVGAEIYHISNDENGYALLFIKCEKYVEEIFSARTSEIEVVLRQYTGYRVPIYAIRVENNQTGIMIKKGLDEVFKPCEIVYRNDEEGFVVIRSEENSPNEIKQNDVIILGEK